MKNLPLVLLSLLCLLAACGEPENPAELNPTKPAPAQPSDTVTDPNIFTLGDARFSAHSFDAEGAALAVGDFNNDGHLDLVSAGQPQLTIFLGDGTGQLSPFSHPPGGENPVNFALADLDQDGDLDIAIANHDTDYITLLLNDGSGEFQTAPNSPFRVAVSPHPHAVQAVDLDADGRVELVVDHRDAEGLLIFRGIGNGEFETPGIFVNVGGDPYRGMAFGDLNGDGLLDLVTPNPREVGVLIHTSSEEITFTQVSSVPAEAPFAVALGDFNGDGLLDLLAASDEGSALVELFWGDGQGGFTSATDSPFMFTPGGKKIAVGDFTGDRIDDAAVSSYQSQEVLVLLGGPGSIQAGFLPAIEHPWDLAAGDFNEDGIDDLMIGDDTALKVTLYLSLIH